MISYKERNNILRKFPNIKPSYEKNLHNKVDSNNLYMLIPKGKKYFIWFTKLDGNNVCLLLYYNKKSKKIQDIIIKNCIFDNILTSNNGTIFYGTYMDINKYEFFHIENIFYYKGNNMIRYNEYKKWSYLENIVNKSFNKNIYSINYINIILPIMSMNHNYILSIINNVSYDVYCIQHRNPYKNKIYLNEKINTRVERYATFNVKASDKTDIYMLYYLSNNNLKYYNIARIPDYKTSIFMNTLLRNIKENYDLDEIEMSDDEEDFENVSDDKYLKKETEYNIKCVYNYKYKQWTPIELSNERIINKNNIMFLEK